MREHLFSWGYKGIRSLIKQSVFYRQRRKQKVHDLEDVVNSGKTLVSLFNNRIFSTFLFQFKTKSSLEVSIYDLTFASPLTFSAYEAHIPLLDVFFKLGVGGGAFKTIRLHPHTGNERPRIQEILIDNEPCLINAMGLPSKGVKRTMKEILSSSLLTYNRPIGLSIGGETVQEYKDLFKIIEASLSSSDFPFYVEINISCPNTKEGQRLSEDVSLLEELLSHIRSYSHRVISVKLSPDQTNASLIEMRDAISKFPKMMINVGNTQFKTCEAVSINKKSLSRGGGGVSGPYIYKRTLEMIKLLMPCSVPIIATGGIDSVEKVSECLDAGASLIGMASALVFDPYSIVRITKALHKQK
ncbi:hypothetical protein DID78_03045 [Candidatus Marinamargulisbacteria bacterium SCGC AG-343-D04]|nr:hypothetical protein DID78_03045 [Candidatus Marinamargulisbacteria bacterium SCGC AG-343-D04]